MIELEKTYLAKFIPSKLENGKEMIDIYIPDGIHHAPIRIRKNGNKYYITKKQPAKENDHSVLIEQTIELSEPEFIELEKEIKGRRIEKIRYNLNHNGNTAEIDVFKEKLKGLVLVDFEFKTNEEKEKFKMPDFCLIDVTQEEFIAGGMLCGKSYEDIEEDLNRLNYKKIESE
jgi:CYTH domain-containing protein